MTGVQTCALPISAGASPPPALGPSSSSPAGRPSFPGSDLYDDGEVVSRHGSLSSLDETDLDPSAAASGGGGIDPSAGSPDSLASSFPGVCVMQSDLVGFTELSTRLQPEALCQMLHNLFSCFDAFTEELRVHKIMTVGDAYVVAAGCVAGDSESISDNARSVAQLALRLQHFCRSFAMPDGTTVRMRIGIHAGPAVAGVVGDQQLRCDLESPGRRAGCVSFSPSQFILAAHASAAGPSPPLPLFPLPLDFARPKKGTTSSAPSSPT